MPRNATVSIPNQSWTELTANDITEITFAVLGNECIVMATTGAAPTVIDGIEYRRGEGEAKRALADLFPGVSGADRLWCYSLFGTQVFVSHA